MVSESAKIDDGRALLLARVAMRVSAAYPVADTGAMQQSIPVCSTGAAGASLASARLVWGGRFGDSSLRCATNVERM